MTTLEAVKPRGGHEAEAGADRARRVDGRRRRYRLARWLQDHSGLKSVRLCGLPLGGTVTVGVVDQGGQLVAHVGGIGRCGSPWACSTCTPAVREHRAREIDAGAAEALDRGWSVLMVSCTLGHAAGDELARTFGIVRAGHRVSRRGRPWQRVKADQGYRGAIRCWEMPNGANGWHPHSHELLFFDRKLGAGDVDAVRAHYRATYGRHVEAATGVPLHPVHGIDVRRVGKLREVGSYLCKVEGGWGAGLELARSDVKKARGGRNPWEILTTASGNGAGDVEAGTLGDVRDRELWAEYEAATYGKRAVTWSPGLRAELLGAAPELSDEEAAAVEAEREAVWTVDLPADQWCRVRRAGCIPGLLEECEARASVELRVGRAAGGGP